MRRHAAGHISTASAGWSTHIRNHSSNRSYVSSPIKAGRIKGVAHSGEPEAIIEQVLWEGVQAKLSTHVSKQRKGRAESPGDAINAKLAAASYNQVAEVLWLTTP